MDILMQQALARAYFIERYISRNCLFYLDFRITEILIAIF